MEFTTILAVLALFIIPVSLAGVLGLIALLLQWLIDKYCTRQREEGTASYSVRTISGNLESGRPPTRVIRSERASRMYPEHVDA